MDWWYGKGKLGLLGWIFFSYYSIIGVPDLLYGFFIQGKILHLIIFVISFPYFITFIKEQYKE